MHRHTALCVWGTGYCYVAPGCSRPLLPSVFPSCGPAATLDPRFPHHSSFSSDPCSPSVLSSPHHPSWLTSHPFPAFPPPHKCSPARGPSLSPDPPPSHPPINPPRQPCYHGDRASAKPKSRTWLPWFPLLRLQPRPRAGWDGRGVGVGGCTAAALAPAQCGRSREPARPGRGGAFRRRGREKKRIGRGVELAPTVAGEGRAGPEAAGW